MHFSVQFSSRAVGPSLISGRPTKRSLPVRPVRSKSTSKVNGWTVTLAKFKSRTEPKNNGAIQTVGELIGGDSGDNRSRGRTLREYSSSFRRKIAGASGIDDPKKYDYREGDEAAG